MDREIGHVLLDAFLLFHPVKTEDWFMYSVVAQRKVLHHTVTLKCDSTIKRFIGFSAIPPVFSLAGVQKVVVRVTYLTV